MKALLIALTFFMTSILDVKINLEPIEQRFAFAIDLGHPVFAEESLDQFVGITLDDGTQIGCPDQNSIANQIKGVCSQGALKGVIGQSLAAGTCTVSGDGSNYNCANQNAQASRSTGLQVFNRLQLCRQMQKQKYSQCEQAKSTYEGLLQTSTSQYNTQCTGANREQGNNPQICEQLSTEIQGHQNALAKIKPSSEALKPSSIGSDGVSVPGGPFSQGIDQLSLAAKDAGVSYNAFQNLGQELKNSYNKNPGTYQLGALAVGAGFLYKKHKDKQKKSDKKKKAKRAALNEAKTDLESVSACSKPGSEALPVCQSYMLSNCQAVYPTVDNEGRGSAEIDQVSKKRDEILNAACTNFVVKHCGGPDSPTDNTESEFCEDMLDKKYCTKASNAKEPYCIMLANQDNPLCANGACDSPFTDEYMAENCPSVPSGKYCRDYLRQQAEEELAALEQQATGGTAAVGGSLNGAVTLNTPVFVSSADATGYVDIAPSFAPNMVNLVSGKIQSDCDNGVMVTCISRRPSSK